MRLAEDAIARHTLLRFVLAGIVTLVIALIFIGGRPSPQLTIQFDRQGTPQICGLRLSNPKVRAWFYRNIGFLKPVEVTVSQKPDTPLEAVVRTLNELKTAGVFSIKLAIQK